ncbi:hypothetical protein [Novipirellula caenicola]|uniref:Uncharacterized protein n=1 Tax=Novipirellula caenicola TaxID=1536901 RepID=A0ABP9VTU4_9BACT
MSDENGPAAVAVLDAHGCHFIRTVDPDTALTLFAVVSEDPHDWDEIVDYWPRYRTPVVCEFLSGLAVENLDQKTAIETIRECDAWMVLDLNEKRLITGPGVPAIGRDEAFSMAQDDASEEERQSQNYPLSIHLPPWWELHEQVDTAVIDAPRETPINKPHVDRNVLYGDPLIQDIAARTLETAASEAWLASDASENPRSRHPFTIAVHRDWLMTPRDDLDGRMPRQLLHGGHHWIGLLVWGQQLRVQEHAPVVAAPDHVFGYETAPMGDEEMVVYFDLCRELIDAAWDWCTCERGKHAIEHDPEHRLQLVQWLREVKQQWLEAPFEGGSPPSFIIECSQRRVPRGVGVPIEGMTRLEEKEQHVIDCDCPICSMMADGVFGMGFVGLDGHHLELDNEFAFSMFETREQWEEEQRSYAAFSEEFEHQASEHSEPKELDEFESVWSGIVSDAPIPGDPNGHLKMAFLLAEIISDMETLENAEDEIPVLNERFRDYRNSDEDQLTATAERLKRYLQFLANEHPELTGKSADFQSRIDEQLRQRDSDAST